MMNKRIQIGLILAISLILLLGLTVPSMARKTPDFITEYAFDDIDWDTYQAFGDFKMYYTATPEDFASGEVEMNWNPKPGMKNVEMIFTDPSNEDNGFSALITLPIEQANTGLVCGTGSFVIHGGSWDGIPLWKSGTITMCREGQHLIYGTLDALIKGSP